MPDLPTRSLRTYAQLRTLQAESSGRAYQVISFWRERQDGVPVGERLDVLAEDQIETALAIMGCTELRNARAMVDQIRQDTSGQPMDISECCSPPSTAG